ncbi:acyl carrier protein [Nocardia sp. NPDC051570]|uniref:acyl carrier protein n=1 Tax=Nocardia sp. NPDC051570 TaxID=3364324 RepID=UPI0037B900D4
MNQAVLTDKVVTILAGMVELAPDSLEWSMRLFDDLGLDSIRALELLLRIEDETGIEFDENTLEQHHFATVGSLVGYALDQVEG